MIDEQNDGTGQTALSDTERMAMAQGWRPKSQFSGDDSRYMDADQFLESINNSAPAMRERLEKTSKKVVELEAHLDTLISNMEKFQKQQYQRAFDDIMQQQRAAVKRGDDQAWEALEKQKMNLATEGQKEVDRQQNGRPAVAPEVLEFIRENTWYENPQFSHMRKYADAIDDELYKQAPGRSIAQHLKLLRQRMEEQFPDFFGVKAQKREKGNKLSASMVEGGARMANGNDKDITDVLPPAVRDYYKRRVEAGKYSSIENIDLYASKLLEAEKTNKKMKLVGAGKNPKIVLEDR